MLALSIGSFATTQNTSINLTGSDGLDVGSVRLYRDFESNQQQVQFKSSASGEGFVVDQHTGKDGSVQTTILPVTPGSNPITNNNASILDNLVDLLSQQALSQDPANQSEAKKILQILQAGRPLIIAALEQERRWEQVLTAIVNDCKSGSEDVGYKEEHKDLVEAIETLWEGRRFKPAGSAIDAKKIAAAIMRQVQAPGDYEILGSGLDEILTAVGRANSTTEATANEAE